VSPNWFHPWFRGKTSAKGGHRRKARARGRLELEQLENRLVPAAFTWNGSAKDSFGNPDPHWSNPDNWGEHQHPSATDPEKDDFIIFPASGDVVDFNPIDDLEDVQVMQIQIVGSGYTFNSDGTTLFPKTVHLDTNTLNVPGLLVQGDNNVFNINLDLLTTVGDMRFEVSDVNQFTLGSFINGAGGFRKQGTGTLILAPGFNNTYNGNTTVDGGVLEIRQAGALGDATAGTTVNSPGTLRLTTGSSGGAEPLTLFGTGGTTNRGALNFTDTVINAAATTAWDGDITLSTAGVVVRVDGFFNDELTLNGRVRGTGGLTKVGLGALTFAGTESNDYTGTTRVNEERLKLGKTAGVNAVSGPLVIGDGTAGAEVFLLADNQIANTASVTINVRGNMILSATDGVTNHSDTIGSLTLTGSAVDATNGNPPGVLTLNGNVTATSITVAPGDTRVSAINGVLALSLGGATRTFTVNDGPHDPDLIVSVDISGAAGVGLTKTGAGKMIMNGANTYTGLTTINAGILVVNAAQGNSNTLVNSGGTLAGRGTVGTLGVNAGGTVEPDTFHTLTVNGNGKFASQATFSAKILGDSAGKLTATHTVFLDNAALRVSDSVANLPTLNSPLTIISAPIVTGTFDGLPNGAIVVSKTGSGLSYRVNYTATTVTLTRVSGPAFQSRAITSPIDEGSGATLTGHITTILPTDTFFLEVNWGDGSRTETFRFGPNASRDVILHHRYLDDGVYAVGLLWRDQRGGFNTDTLTIRVNNVAPVVDAGGDATLHNGTLNRQVTFTDPGRDTWRATVDFGDGSPPQVFDLRDSTRFQLRHRFAQPGTYRVTVTVFDDDGGVGTDTFLVIVPPHP
jgi:autotransporter-associated beta strand protein